MEAVRLRVRDVDFDYLKIVVRDGKSEKERMTTLPRPVVDPLHYQLERVRLLHEKDLRGWLGEVYPPYALAHQYRAAARKWAWQYVFPSVRLQVHPRWGGNVATTPQPTACNGRSGGRFGRQGSRSTGVCRPPRHGFATHLLGDGYELQTTR